MNLKSYLKDRGLLILGTGIGMLLVYAFLRLTGYPKADAVLLLFIVVLVFVIRLVAVYRQRLHYFRAMQQRLDALDQPYLLGELLPDSPKLEDRIYRVCIRASNKAAIEKIHEVEDRELAYREYIEGWVHEQKAAITAIFLLCENGKRDKKRAGELFRRIAMENLKLENEVDVVLYYARSAQVYKDYLIRKTNLQEIAGAVLAKNRYLLMEHQMQAEVVCNDLVYTDEKWVQFMLNQMVLNCVKYRRDMPPGEAKIRITTQREADAVLLLVQDNGTGIKAEELSRIFEKGFTGTNGRNKKQATGMGLYLCKKLSDQLGIGLSVRSVYTKGTQITMKFPVNTYITDGREHIQA